jgi:ATP-dependent exoDNAse (exonuclease V) alpha subunit
VCSAHHFDENVPEPPWRDIAGTDEYTFAYCGTVHKMQGSQFPHIVVSDESFVFRDQEWKHRYTAITRASERADIFL